MNPPTINQLTDAFEKATVGGPENLTGTDRDYYLIQDFILEWEDGGLNEFFFDCLPEFDLLTATIEAMKRNGLVDLGTILAEAVELFKDYQEPNPPILRHEVAERYDPTNKLATLDQRISQLPDYGLAS